MNLVFNELNFWPFSTLKLKRINMYIILGYILLSLIMGYMNVREFKQIFPGKLPSSVLVHMYTRAPIYWLQSAVYELMTINREDYDTDH